MSAIFLWQNDRLQEKIGKLYENFCSRRKITQLVAYQLHLIAFRFIIRTMLLFRLFSNMFCRRRPCDRPNYAIFAFFAANI